MILLSLIFFGVIAKALWSILNARFVREVGDDVHPLYVQGGSFLFASVYIGFVWFGAWHMGAVSVPHSTVFWSSLAVTAILNIFFEALLFRSYRLAPIGLIAPFSAVSPILTVVTAWVLLGELPSALGFAGILLIAVSIYLLHVERPWSWAHIAQPFVSMWGNRGVRYGFLAALPPALSIVFDRKAVDAADPISFSFIAIFCIGLGSWLCLLFFRRGNPFRMMEKWHLKRFLQIGFFHSISNVLLTSALLFGIVPYISAFRRIDIVLQILFAALILGEKDHLKKRLLVSGGVVAGVILIALSR